MFALGQKADGQGAKHRMNVEQLAEERMASTLAIKDSSKRDAKRERDDYAVNLRKQKR